MGLFQLLQNFNTRQTPIHFIKRRVLLAGVEYKIKLAKGEKNLCKRTDDTLMITLKEMTKENFELFYDSWYRREARKLFKASITKWIEVMRNLGYDIHEPRIKIYHMHKAWGRCYYTKNVITLNYYLAMAPLECIDCITMHELCHLIEGSHSKVFYGMMDNIDPEWREKDKKLREFAQAHLF